MVGLKFLGGRPYSREEACRLPTPEAMNYKQLRPYCGAQQRLPNILAAKQGQKELH